MLSFWHFNCLMKFTWSKSQRFKCLPLQVTLTLCGNTFIVLRQYINFMSQQATTGILCQTKQCLIGFWSMATPPEAPIHLLFQQHLERNAGDYIPPVVSRCFYPCRPLGARCRQPWYVQTCCSVWLLANTDLQPRIFCYWDEPRFKLNRDHKSQTFFFPSNSRRSKMRIRKDHRKRRLGLNLPVAAGKRQSCQREIWKQKNLQIIFFFFFLHHIIVTSSFSVDSYGWMVKYAPSPHIDEVSVSYLSWIFFSGLSSFLSSCHKQVSLIDWWLNYHLEENRRSAGKYVCTWSHNGLPICSGYTFPWPCHDSTISPQFCPPEGALARV